MQKLITLGVELFKKYKKLVMYGIFGVLTTIVNVVVYALLYKLLNVPNIPSVLIAWVAAIAVAFVTNKLWVFTSPSWDQKTVISELTKFIISRLATLGLEIAIMFVAVDVLSLPEILFKIIANIIVILVNYVLSNLIIFKQKKVEEPVEKPAKKSAIKQTKKRK